MVPADARLDNRAFRQQAGIKNVRMIDAERVQELVGRRSGRCRRSGACSACRRTPIRRSPARDLIAFNVGARDVSVTMSGPDYAALERPTLGRFARRAKPKGAQREGLRDE